MSTIQDIEVRKSEHDIREYKVMNVRNSGLQALLVHDPRVVTEGEPRRKNTQLERLAAVSMSINIGSFHSPKNMHGLTHLVEHMYTQDGKNISKNDGFDRFVSEHGGFTNAERLAEYSTFYFNISGSYLKGALKRFADCMIDPDIEKTALESELEAVDKEFLTKKDYRECILEYLRSYTLKETDHPHYDIFQCGNKESLMGGEEDCDNLLKKVEEFRSINYHGENMKLVIIAGEPPDVLERWVLELFHGLPGPPKSANKKRKIKHSTTLEHWQLELPKSLPCLWTPGEQYFVEAPDDDDILEISWALPSLRRMYQYKPEGYLTYLMNQKGEGSLMSLLKHKGWITYLKSGVECDGGMYRTWRNYIFTIRFDLTKSGVSEVNSIITFVYEYLNLLRSGSPQEWIGDEIKKIEMMKFNYEAEEQFQYAIRHSVNLLLYPPEDVIFADHEYRWNESLIKQVLSYLTPENMRIDHVKSDFASEDDESGEEVEDDEHVEGADDVDVEESQEQSESNLNNDGDAIVEDDEPVEEAVEDDVHLEEASQDDVDEEGSQEQSEPNLDDGFKRLPWFETRYYVEDIDKELMKLWKESSNIHRSLKFPSSNKFIPKNFSVHVGGTSRENNSTLPECVLDKGWVKVWCKQDKVFCVPQAAIYLRIHFYGAWNGPRNCILSELFEHLLYNKLSEVIFKAEMVRCKIELQFIDGMLELKIFGFSSVLLRLLSEILEEIGSFVPTSDRYNQIKDRFKRNLSNDSDPYFEVLLREHSYFGKEMVDHLKDTLLLDFKGFIEEIQSKVVFIESLCNGNVKKEDAFEIYNIVKKSFRRYDIPDGSKQVAERVFSLPPSANIVASLRPSSKHYPNSSVEVYYQIGRLKMESVKLFGLLHLFLVIVEPLFNKEMRTKKNYCYDLSSCVTKLQNVLGFTFEIVSDFGPYMLQAEIERFVDNDLEKHLRDLEETTFQNYKTSVLERILQDHSSLEKESRDLWAKITLYRSRFDIFQKGTEILQKLDKKDLIEFYGTYFKSSSSNCRRMQIITVNYTIKDMKDEDAMEKIIEIKKNGDWFG